MADTLRAGVTMVAVQRRLGHSSVRVTSGTCTSVPEAVEREAAAATVASGLNAVAHCVDSLWAPQANPVSTASALEGLRCLAAGLPVVRSDSRDIAARHECLHGTYLAAVAFAGAGSGIHHKICHVLGGAYDLEHAAMHAVVLPHVVGFNAPAVPAAAARLASALAGAGFGDGRTAGRAHLFTDAEGRYRFWGVTPAPYPIPHDGPVGDLLAATNRSPMRAAHLHFMVTAPGLRRLVTHIFVEGDELLARDAVFGVKESLIKPFTRHRSTDPTPDGREPAATWTDVVFDIVLAREPI